ncbi:MAG: TolC family protein [Rhodobacteraceae bacterium]|nr:TolC family protein [Paracoccaceae bacterium]
MSAESLREAVQYALTTNPSIRASQSDMRAAAFELMELRGEFLPVVTLDAESGYERIDDPSSLSASDNDSTKPNNLIGLRAEIVLFDGFRRSNLVYANCGARHGSIFRLLDASETMALNATEAYIDVYRHRVLTEVAARNVTKHEEIGQRVTQLVEGGRLPYSDQLTIEDRIKSARLALLEVQRALRDADARYERVVGRKPSGGMSVPRAPVPASLQALTEQAVRNSFRVRFARTQIDQSRFQTEVELSDWYPRLTLKCRGLARDQSQWGKRHPHRSGDRDRVALDALPGRASGGTQRPCRAQQPRCGAAGSRRARSHRTRRTHLEHLSHRLEATAQLDEQLRINALIVEVYGEEFDAAKRSLLDLLEVERARFNVEFEAVGARAGLAFSTYRALAAQSLLAEHFGVPRSEITLEPQFQERARSGPTAVFNVAIEPLK